MLQQKIDEDLLSTSEAAVYSSAEITISSAMDIIGIWLRYTTLIFVRSFTTILVVIGLQQYAKDLLLGLYILLPDWVTDLTDNMTEAIVTSFSAGKREGDVFYLVLVNDLSGWSIIGLWVAHHKPPSCSTTLPILSTIPYPH